jgi:putative ABC transport system permease protein
VTALYRKLVRELWHMRGQVIAIAVVIAGGMATLVMSLTSLDALTVTRDAYYRDYRFADVFATLKRAPESLREAVEAIPGVLQVETRVVAGANLDIPDFADPASGILISLPDGRNAELNRLFLRAGRLPEPGRAGEAVINEGFAEAHGFVPGDRFGAVINGRRQNVEIVGIALSPEYIYHVAPGELFPDFARMGILWMNRTHLAAAFDMDGAFNDLVLTLTHDARSGDVIQRLDALLAPYGGRGAVDREDQLSHRYLALELEQLRTMATVFPAMFLAVAAFLLNVVLTRLINTQRDQLGILKAFGYSNLEVGLHYAQMVLVIMLLGLALGTGVGLWLGQMMAELYQEFFRFPYLELQLRTRSVAIGTLVTVTAGLLGTVVALVRVVRMPPAEAMRPEPAPVFRATVVERLGLQRLLAQPTRMILRNIERRPFKALLSATGIAFACGILVIGSYQEGAITYLIKVQYGQAQRDDLTVVFVEPTSRRALHELAALPGVDHAEPFRSAAVRLTRGTASYRTAIQGLEPGSRLRRVLDDELRVVTLPREGLVLNDFLAEYLDARPGDTVGLEFLEGRREQVAVPVTGVVREFTGATGYMDLEALNRIMREGTAISGAWLSVDHRARDDIVRTLKDVPRVAGVTDRLTAVQNFLDEMANIVLTFSFFSTLLAGSIAFGVVYNSARIALTERARELASLRVLGLTRGEISYILLGELFLITLAAILPGFLIGQGLVYLLVGTMDSDLYRVPLIITPDAYAFAATVILVATALSALVVMRRLNQLDLVEVLKSRE